MNPLIKNTLSIVIPTFNEEGNIEILYSKLIETLTPLEIDEFEFVFVDEPTGNTFPKHLDVFVVFAF